MIDAEEHAADRLRQRFGLWWTFCLRAELLDAIAAARAADNRHPRACLIERQTNHRERWIVSTRGVVMQAVIDPPRFVTFLPANAKRIRP